MPLQRLIGPSPSSGNVRPGQNILIVGAGGLGIHAVQIAKLCGARVLVADRKKKALQLAEEFGADVLIDADASPLERIRETTKGKGVDAVIEIVGAKETLAWSLPSLKKGGKLIIVGYVPGPAFPSGDHGHALQRVGDQGRPSFNEG